MTPAFILITNCQVQIMKKIIIFDGAMGTYYSSISRSPYSKCELANIHDKKIISRIHKEYINAGCNAIRTNTFAANKINLGCDSAFLKDIIRQGYEIALEAARDTDILVFADIGPVPSDESMDGYEAYKEIVDTFLNSGAKNFIFESFPSDEHLHKLSGYIKEKCPEAYIIVEFAISPEGITRLGQIGSKLLEDASRVSTIDAYGFNCYSGPYHLLQYIKKLNLNNKTVSVMPNSGYPAIINNRMFFENSKEYFAMQMEEIVNCGVSIIGGCCGTTPEYIEEAVKRVKGVTFTKAGPKATITEEHREQNIKNELLDKIENGKKIIAVELDPPLDTNISSFIECAKKLKKKGVDAITIADCPIARARVDSSLLACKLKRELDITAIPHLTCRDRNINAIKALLLGINIEGVNDVLVVTGDPVPASQRDEIKAMFSFNSSVLANYIMSLNKTVFSVPFNVYGALNINARNFEHQMEYAKKKINSGISMFFTQPVFTEQAMNNLRIARQELNAKILGGILPVISYKNACFINNEISGIDIPEDMIELYHNVTDDEAVELAVGISANIANKMSPYIDGYYFITPFKKVDIIIKILDKIMP